MRFLNYLLAAYIRRGWRGSTRTANFLSARLKSLRSQVVATDSGPLVVDLRMGSAHGIFAGSMADTGEKAVIERFVRDGDVVYDIGAHFGWYTVLLARLAGEKGAVHAFEPNPELLPSLRKTAAMRDNVALHEVALSDKSGTVDLFVPEDASMASLSDWTGGIGGDVHKIQCRMIPLDEFAAERGLPLPQFIKCDVEGAEFSVFSGALGILNREDAPIVMFELNRQAARSFGKETGDYLDLLESLDKPRYKFFEVLTGGIGELTERSVEYKNILAIPAARYLEEAVAGRPVNHL